MFADQGVLGPGHLSSQPSHLFTASSMGLTNDIEDHILDNLIMTIDLPGLPVSCARNGCSAGPRLRHLFPEVLTLKASMSTVTRIGGPPYRAHLRSNARYNPTGE